MTQPDEPYTSDNLEVGRYGVRTFKLIPGRAPPIATGSWWEEEDYSWRWRSVVYSKTSGWEDGTCTAHCYVTRVEYGGRSIARSSVHESPNEKCSCGVYGSLSYADLMKQFASQANRIVAVIAAEGTTIIGSRGFRTQFARVVAYWTASERSFRQVATNQFKDATLFESPTDMCNAYGIAVSSDDSLGGDYRWWTK